MLLVLYEKASADVEAERRDRAEERATGHRHQGRGGVASDKKGGGSETHKGATPFNGSLADGLRDMPVYSRGQWALARTYVSVCLRRPTVSVRHSPCPDLEVIHRLIGRPPPQWLEFPGDPTFNRELQMRS